MPEPGPVLQKHWLLPRQTQATPALCQLAQELSRAAKVAPALGQALLQMLSPYGSALGLAAAHPHNPVTLLLPHVLTLVLGKGGNLLAPLGLTPEAGPKLGAALTDLLQAKAQESAWAALLAPPDFAAETGLLLENPVLYAHWHIGHSAMADRLALHTQQAVVSRLDQLSTLDPEARAHHLLTFLRLPIRVAVQIRPEDLAAETTFTLTRALLELGWKTIKQFDNYATLSQVTRETYEENWYAFLAVNPATREFSRRASPQRAVRAAPAQPSRHYDWPGRRREGRTSALAKPEDKEFAEQPEVRAFEAEAAAAAQERAQTLRPFSDPSNRARRKDGRAPEMVAHPSARAAGVWSTGVLALQLDALQDEFGEALVYWRQRVLLNLHVHTGLPSAVIETLAVAHNEPARLEFWTYLPAEGRLCVRPRRFLGRPPDLQPECQVEGDPAGPERRGGHRPVADCLSVPLPGWLVAEIRLYLRLLQQAKGGEIAGQGVDWPLFWPPAQAARANFALPFREVLDRLHQRISRRIPGLVAFTPGQAALTFEGLYASAGLDPVYRYYVNHRKYRHLLLPVWYACVSADELAARYEQASLAVWSQVQDAWRALRGSAIPLVAESDSAARTAVSGRWYGNFHCPRAEVVCTVMAEAQRADRSPVWSSAGLTEEELAHNRRTEEVALRVLLLTGLRPFELKRLTAAMVDLFESSLAVEGKAHRLGGMGRVLPASRLLELKNARKAMDPGALLFELYDQPGHRCPLETGHLQILVDRLAEASGQLSFDVYGLRVLYRSELLSLGVGFDQANYLMGHQSAGGELFNLRVENRWPDVVDAARRVTGALAEHYLPSRGN